MSYSFEPLLQRSKNVFNGLLRFFHTLIVDLNFHLAAGQLLVDFILHGSRNLFLDIVGCALGNSISVFAKLLDVHAVVWVFAAHCGAHLHAVFDRRGACFIHVHIHFSFNSFQVYCNGKDSGGSAAAQSAKRIDRGLPHTSSEFLCLLLEDGQLL